MADYIFIVFIAFFLTHELDAMQRCEWRILPVLSRLPEPLAARIFIWAHIPLFAFILWDFVNGSNASLFRNALAGFGVVHVALHWLFQRHPANGFNNLESKVLIWLTGLCGGVYLGLQLW